MTPTDRHIGSKFIQFLSVAFIISSITAFQTLHSLVLPENLAQAGHYQFLTNIALCVSTVYFTINLIYHAFKLKFLYVVKEYISAVSVSLNFVVSSVYWSLKIFVPELIISKEDTFPFSLDIKIHLIPLLFTSIDYFIFMDRWEVPYLSGYAIVATLAGTYWFWLEYLITENAAYPYPFLNVEKNLRIIIFIIISLVAFGAFCLGKLIHPDFVPELQKAEEDYAKKIE
jgi:hypothetical protein